MVPEPDRPHSLESTGFLLGRIRSGDLRARDRLIRRYLPGLRRWASGRLPAAARELLSTDDLVQATLTEVLEQEEMPSEQEGAFLAHLRRIVLRRIREEFLGARRRTGREDPVRIRLPWNGPSAGKPWKPTTPPWTAFPSRTRRRSSCASR